MAISLIARAPLPPNVDQATSALPAYMWTGCGIATLVLAVRLYHRLSPRQSYGWDDTCIVGAYIFALLLYAGTQVSINHQYGRHVEYIPPPDLVVILEMNVVITIAGFISLALSRTSIGLFLLRVVGKTDRKKWIVYLGLVLNVTQALVLIVLTGVQCVPIKKQWDPTTPGFCIPKDSFTIVDRFFGCINVIVDLIFALYSFYVVHGLKMQRKWRLALYLLLTCGLLAAVCSIGRVVASDLSSTDPTWDLIPLTFWALSEVSGVLILASMPAFHQLLVQFRHSQAWNNSMARLKGPMSWFSASKSRATAGTLGDSDQGSCGDLIFQTTTVSVQPGSSIDLESVKRNNEDTNSLPVNRQDTHWGAPGQVTSMA
ncbi:MAG: hypothetical protein M1828_001121 [Chrysothrix sp. TS-e1954]|nr:MAG: hypothetical protein M1828_001121 [Chrysothrix sp. TS-e1954]